MVKKKENLSKKIFSKFLDDITLKDWLEYYWYNLTFRRHILVKKWAEPNEQESIKQLTATLRKMDDELSRS